MANLQRQTLEWPRRRTEQSDRRGERDVSVVAASEQVRARLRALRPQTLKAL